MIKLSTNGEMAVWLDVHFSETIVPKYKIIKYILESKRAHRPDSTAPVETALRSRSFL